MSRRSKQVGFWYLDGVQFNAKGRLIRARVKDSNGRVVKLSRPRAATTAVIGSRLVAILKQIADGAEFQYLMLASEHPLMGRPAWLAEVAELLALAERSQIC